MCLSRFQLEMLIHIHCEANYHEDEAEKNNRASLGGSIRDVSCKNRQKCSSDVDWNSHELRFARSVSQVLDDGREEETDSIKRADNLSEVSFPNVDTNEH